MDIDGLPREPRPRGDKSRGKTSRVELKLLKDDYETMYPQKKGSGFKGWLDESSTPTAMPMSTKTQSEVVKEYDDETNRKEEERALEKLFANPDTKILYVHGAAIGEDEDQIILACGTKLENSRLETGVKHFYDLLSEGQNSNVIKFPRPVDLSTKREFLQILSDTEFHGTKFQGERLRVMYPVDMQYNPERLDRVVDDPKVRIKAENFFSWWTKRQDRLVGLTLGHDGQDIKTIGLKFSYEDYDDVVVLSFDTFKGLTEGAVLGGHDGMIAPDTDGDTARDVLLSLKIDGVLINQRATVKLQDLRE